MAERIAAGTWVELHLTVLPAGERAPQVPEDTRRTALEMRVKGFLRTPASMGEKVEIETPAGRIVSGRLMDANPSYSHGFGAPVAELDRIGGEVRAILNERGIFL